MILAFELVWTGTHHAPGNSATIQTIAAAFPGQEIRVFAEMSHLAELSVRRNVTLHAVRVSRHFRFRPQIVSMRRGVLELATLCAALRHVPRDEPCLVVLLSATPTAIFAAELLARLSRRRIGVQVGLHGNLNDAFAWRSRNPLTRMFDLHAALTHGTARFLVLEPAIKATLSRRLPAAEARTDVLPLPVNATEIAGQPVTDLDTPIRIGLVGQATEAKGIIPFLELAAGFGQTNPGEITFHLVGRAPVDAEIGGFGGLAERISTDPLTREDFRARLGQLHFVCLPLQAAYYELSASGALIDAITWLKPVIATRLPIVIDLFEKFGDIGYLCDDTATMRTAIAGILATRNADRYARQQATLKRARDARMPGVLADKYRRIVHAGFPGLLP